MITDKYPYFIYPYVKRLRENPDLSEDERMELMRKVAANVGDVPSLRIILGIDPEEFACFYPDMSYGTPSTPDTIDTFINKFGGNTATPEILKDLESRPADMEEIAREYILNRQYREALEIISALNLNNPEKSIYFAHQIRFLKKLIKLETRN